VPNVTYDRTASMAVVTLIIPVASTSRSDASKSPMVATSTTNSTGPALRPVYSTMTSAASNPPTAATAVQRTYPAMTDPRIERPSLAVSENRFFPASAQPPTGRIVSWTAVNNR